MPEYILPISNIADFNSLDDFTKGYIEAAFFCECNCDNKELEHAETGDISPESMSEVIADCTAWQAMNANLLTRAYDRDYDATRAGRDYWFTRNGHGVGFWDREALNDDDLGDALTLGCDGEVSIYKGDDGLIYFGG